MFPTSYLESKVSVDDRVLNRPVWERFWAALPATRPVEILELGAGHGAMIERLVGAGRLRRADVTALDRDAAHVAEIRRRLPSWLERQPGWDIRPVQAALDEWLEREPDRRWDVLVAHAFLDLFHLPSLLPQLFDRLRPGGLLYATLNFNGHTAFEPLVDPSLDHHIMALYHRSMDVDLPKGKRSGSRAGSQLLLEIPASGGEILAAGGSDWVVMPVKGGYPAAEAAFLNHILNFFQQSLTGHPDLDPHSFENWLNTRRSQIDRGRLAFTAHHLDVLALKPV